MKVKTVTVSRSGQVGIPTWLLLSLMTTEILRGFLHGIEAAP